MSQQQTDTEAGKQSVIESLNRTKEIGFEIKAALEEGDLVAFGGLLNKHWENKKARSTQISDARIDRVYQIAMDNGAIGGKVMGAGGGGFLMLLADGRAQRIVRDAVAAEGLRQMSFNFDLDGAKVLLNA